MPLHNTSKPYSFANLFSNIPITTPSFNAFIKILDSPSAFLQHMLCTSYVLLVNELLVVLHCMPT
nr:MAG TPA: hypothetical protein [Caudoviricetes sp.]DAY85387.1 MAG TPA: hypothetical protein [Caudoviricetes sp.]